MTKWSSNLKDINLTLNVGGNVNNESLTINKNDSFTKTYDENDLSEGKTGFLPVNINFDTNLEKLTNVRIQSESAVLVSDLMSDSSKNGITKDSTLIADVPERPINLYDPYPSNNPLEITSNTQSVQSISFDNTRYDGLDIVHYEVNVNKYNLTNYVINREGGNNNGGGNISEQFIKVTNGNITVPVNQYSSICIIEDKSTYYSIFWLPAGGGSVNKTVNNGSIYNVFIGSQGQMFFSIKFNDVLSISDDQLNNVDGTTIEISKDIFNIPFLN